jgi:hypothetical protein
MKTNSLAFLASSETSYFLFKLILSGRLRKLCKFSASDRSLNNISEEKEEDSVKPFFQDALGSSTVCVIIN